MSLKELEEKAIARLQAFEPPAEQLPYCIAFTAYHLYAEGKATKEEAQRMKLTGLTYLETLKSLARSSSEIIRELARATAPRKLLGEKDKAELLEVIIRIEGVVTGLMKKFKNDIPKILRTEEGDV